jgi:signal transduction histidine kinase
MYVDQVERLERLRRSIRNINPTVLDALIGTSFVVVAIVGAFNGSATDKYRDTDAIALIASISVAVPYYFRRRAPFAVLLASIPGVVFLTLRNYETGALPTMLLVGVYTVAVYSERWKRAVGLGAIALGLTILGIAGTKALDGPSLVLNFALYTVAFMFGSVVRNRRLYTEQLEQRADVLERERDEEARRAVAEERLRIAQELHDVVAHSMGVIAVQAGVGAHVIDTDPAEAKKSLEAISRTSRSSLAEIRRMLGVLREDEGAQYTPAPGLADLDRLAQEVRGAGVDVEVDWEGTRNELPPGVDFTAYRIVQESLTNVLKHAGKAKVQVTICYEPDALQIEVVDDGRGVNGRATGGGHGLIGMRERAGVYGGSFAAGPRTGGGFRVAVRLPYGDLL